MIRLHTQSGKFTLERLPKTSKGGLRAWDAADELLMTTFFEEKISKDTPPILLIINDSFGALTIALHEYQTHSWSDSYISHLATVTNLELNNLPKPCKLITSTDDLKQHYDFVLIKIPKTLSLLEDQLYRLKPYVTSKSIIISSAMSKNIHTSTLKLFEKIIGLTTTSRATKKARLVFSKVDDSLPIVKSPYPKAITDEKLKLKLLNYANVFSKDNIDIGTRFLIAQLSKCPLSRNIIDLGCGNGALGIMVKRLQIDAKIHFVDESSMAILSAKDSYHLENQDDDASFYLSNGLSQYDGPKADLILCNPPFHQGQSMGDHIAWQMFKQSFDNLTVDGELWVIGNRHLGYHVKLKKLFGNCQTLASNKKFVVLVAKNTKK